MTIEKLAENFVRAAQELVKGVGRMTSLNVTVYTGEYRAHMSEEQFDNFFGEEGIKIVARDDNKYPIEKSIMVGNVKFFCISDNMDTWAKLKGYVRKEAG